MSPKQWKPPFSFNLEIGRVPFSDYWTTGVIRMGSQYESEKDENFPEQKWFNWDANGPDWIPQALETPCLIQSWSWKISLFWLLDHCMKVEKLKNFYIKIGLMGCKWSSLIAPGTGNPSSHLVLGLDDFPFSHYWFSGVIRMGSAPSMKVKKVKIFQYKSGLMGCK